MYETYAKNRYKGHPLQRRKNIEVPIHIHGINAHMSTPTVCLRLFKGTFKGANTLCLRIKRGREELPGRAGEGAADDEAIAAAAAAATAAEYSAFDSVLVILE